MVDDREEVGMSEMVERVARAMVGPLGHDPSADWKRVWVGNALDSGEEGSLANLCRALARAAIEAMREPTDAMIEAADWMDGRAATHWEAMIVAALDPTPC